MTKYIDLHKLAETVGWQPVYVDEGYTSYEYLEKVRNIECLCHVLKLYDDLVYETYLQTFETIINVLPKELIKKIKKLTKKCDPANIESVMDLACYEVEEYRQKTIYNKLFNYGCLLGVDIDKLGYHFTYTMNKKEMRNILSLIESNLPLDLAPILGKIKKLDYKIGYVKQNGIRI